MCSNLAKSPGVSLLTSKMGSFSCGFTQITSKQPMITRYSRLRHYSDALCIPLCSVTDQAMQGVVGLRVVGSLIPKIGNNPIRVRVRNYCGASYQRMGDDGNGEISGDKLPWIAAYNGRKVKVFDEKARGSASGVSSWEESANRYFAKKEGNSVSGKVESRSVESEKPRSVDGMEKGEDGVEEGEEPIDDPRWDKIKSSYNRFVRRDNGYVKPEVARWNKQENWGRKTWKEATTSSIPKMVGEAVYGVGPVLAALTAGRREFYALYVQEGLDLNLLNGKKKKRKDRKGIENIFKMAEKLSLVSKDISKHDLNMIVDNRPHQGLVLDASPLEMVGIKELDCDPGSEGNKAPLWVALDEVTDPQNLGAILRSCYFFGVKGVVVCSKNSAPLSGVVSKASAGSLELIELRSCKNMMQFLTASVENGWRVLGGSVSPKAQPLNEIQPGIPTILVLGSEGSGLRPLVERSCTQLVKIPGDIPLELGSQSGEDEPVEGEELETNCLGQELNSVFAVESLNVSVAAGVLLYHLNGSSCGPHEADQVNDG